MNSPAQLIIVLAWMTALCGYSQQISPPASDLPDPVSIQQAMIRANDYFLTHTTFQSNGWARGVYHTGNMLCYQVLGVERYLQAGLAWAETNRWDVGVKGATNADGQVCGQTYVDLYRIDPQPIRISAIRAAIDERVANPAAVQDWWWIDAFYMAGSVYARLGSLYATNSYFDKMWLMYNDTMSRRQLFDPSYALWYRDADAQTAVTRNGQQQFWSRGNGWVLAGLARALEYMPPSHPHRADFVTMLQTMAATLRLVQSDDGMWRASLLDPSEVPNPETSGTSLFTYGIAWGIRNGLLSSPDYEPVVARAWNSMVTNVLHPDGMVGYVQPQGREPAPSGYDTNADFGVGVFLLAGAEMLRLVGGVPTGPVVLTPPASQTVATGATVGLTNTVVGAPPLYYQWMKDGVAVNKATDSVLLLTNVALADSGDYRLLVTNAAGAATTSVARLTVLNLATALNTTNWSWTGGGTLPWTPQGAVTHDGSGAVQSGRIADSQSSWIEISLTGPATLSFWWRVSSETNKDLLRLFMDGSEQMRVSGEVDWEWRSLTIPTGTHALRWTYSKNSGTARGLDAAWVDQVAIVCVNALAPASRTHGFVAETGLVSVAAPDRHCPWGIFNTNNWINITSGAPSIGTGAVAYVVAPNPAAFGRTGLVMIADQPFTVRQIGAPCTFALAPSARTHGAGVETGLLAVTSVVGCDWTASTTNDWLVITSIEKHTGGGAVYYQLADNPTPELRLGFIFVADQTYTITNLGGLAFVCSPKTVELGAAWDFDSPVATSGCGDPNLTLTVLDTVTNNLDSCGNTFTASRTWQAADGCGHQAVCTQAVTLVDTTPPALNCAGTKLVVCTAAWSFDQPLAVDVADGTNVTLTVLETITNGDCHQAFTATRIWQASDGCGNISTCSQTVTNFLVAIRGTLFCPTIYPPAGPSNKRLAAAPVFLSGDDSQSTLTGSNGTYSFTVNAGGTYMVTPGLPDPGSPAGGITTVDIALLRRHVLSIARIDSPYKLLAADVNASRSVSTLDIAWLQKLLLGSLTDVPSGPWRLVPSDYIFPDPLNPWTAPSRRICSSLFSDATDQDFLAIRIGDVNDSWAPPAGSP